LEGVSLRYVKSAAELRNPDMIIIPGTKNTMKDLLWMRQNGLESSILKAADSGKVIFGICGGYQMLGETISDPDQVEEGGTIKGMCLLPIDTVFQNSKTRTRVSGSLCNLEGILKDLSNTKLEGYEIHMGISKPQGGLSPMTLITDILDEKPKFDGAYSGNVYGTYIHGIFDSEQVAKQLILSLAKEKGVSMDQIEVTDYRNYKDMQYNILADTLRKHLDMKKIYEVLEMGI
jgi:adenosylcobyric acid synthase